MEIILAVISFVVSIIMLGIFWKLYKILRLKALVADMKHGLLKEMTKDNSDVDFNEFEEVLGRINQF